MNDSLIFFKIIPNSSLMFLEKSCITFCAFWRTDLWWLARLLQIPGILYSEIICSQKSSISLCVCFSLSFFINQFLLYFHQNHPKKFLCLPKKNLHSSFINLDNHKDNTCHNDTKIFTKSTIHPTFMHTP